MISKLFKIVIICVLLGGLCYTGACVYANFFQEDVETDDYTVPPVSKARYQIRIHNTGNVLYSNKVVGDGDKIGLYGYWELTEEKFEYRDSEIVLDREVFGKITVRRR